LYNATENEIGEDREEISELKKAPDNSDWDWFMRWRFRGKFRQRYKLHKFPFDKQNCASCCA